MRKVKAVASTYKHRQKAIQRPDVGVEPQFSNRKAPKTYRYDSSLAPDLCWSEDAERPFAEWLLHLVAEAAEKGEAVVFAQPQTWRGTAESFCSLSQCAARLRSLTKPFLNWSGKAERQQISVPTLPLFVHERHSTQAISATLKDYKARGTTMDLFGDANLDVADRLDAYEHKGPWANRLILGDSLHVMNSLLEYEGMGGQVQMIYFDPPYGVKFGSNFQPFVRKNAVKHGIDDAMTREPETVKAYRDTWELGLHSYLTYMRDRLFLARELMADAGSIFIQISDENLHLVREVADEVFDKKNFLVTISFKKKSATTPTDPVNDYLLWYTKDRTKFKPTHIYFRRTRPEDDPKFNTLISPSREMRRIKDLDESEIERLLSEGWRWARVNYPLVSQDESERSQDFTWNGKRFSCGKNRHWTYDPKVGMNRLAEKHRIFDGGGRSLGGIVFWDDWPFAALSNFWDDIHGDPDPIYVVQTSYKVLQRCILMTTAPGDLVLDLTCGSGTTAYMAEHWGRRWITCDTSRVPLALTRQRLLTAKFPWYSLQTPSDGPKGGFVYERKQSRKGEEVGGLVPRITLGSIADDEPPRIVTLVDRPHTNPSITRISGPFTVEATIQAAMTLTNEEDQATSASNGTANPRAYLDRMIEVLRQSRTLQLPGNASLELDAIRPLADREFLHAEALAKSGAEKRIAIVFGSEDGAIGSEYVFNASMEAMQQGFQQLFLFGFAIQAKAREMLEKLKIPTIYIAVTPDVVMSDLLKTTKASEIFSITGLPDITLEELAGSSKNMPLFRVEVKGLDIFRPDTMEIDCVDAENLPCWMLDTDYNGMAFCASQVFFPKTSAWDNLQKSLRGEFNDSVWEHLAGTVSEPFALGDHERIAVKVIDDRGNELMVVKTPARAH